MPPGFSMRPQIRLSGSHPADGSHGSPSFRTDRRLRCISGLRWISGLRMSPIPQPGHCFRCDPGVHRLSGGPHGWGLGQSQGFRQGPAPLVAARLLPAPTPAVEHALHRVLGCISFWPPSRALSLAWTPVPVIARLPGADRSFAVFLQGRRQGPDPVPASGPTRAATPQGSCSWENRGVKAESSSFSFCSSPCDRRRICSNGAGSAMAIFLALPAAWVRPRRLPRSTPITASAHPVHRSRTP